MGQMCLCVLEKESHKDRVSVHQIIHIQCRGVIRKQPCLSYMCAVFRSLQTCSPSETYLCVLYCMSVA